jgi:hypothetical protein
VEKDFCLKFATDYYYRLTQIEETHIYRYGRNTQSYQRSKISRDGAIFLLGQARAESGWGGKAFRSFNFWGLGGDYQQADGSSSFMSFKSFDESFAYLLNHFDRGISRQGYDSQQHPGWPAFMPLMSAPGPLDFSAINQSLNIAKWCKTYPAYNTDQQKHCAGQASCPCLDYAGLIMQHSSKLAVNRCLAVYAKEKCTTEPTSYVFGAKNPPPVPFAKRMEIVHQQLREYAMENYPETYCQIELAPPVDEENDPAKLQCGKPILN